MSLTSDEENPRITSDTVILISSMFIICPPTTFQIDSNYGFPPYLIMLVDSNSIAVHQNPTVLKDITTLWPLSPYGSTYLDAKHIGSNVSFALMDSHKKLGYSASVIPRYGTLEECSR